jgi:aldose 1-epimerase
VDQGATRPVTAGDADRDVIELRAGGLAVAVDPASGGRLSSLRIDGRERLVTEPRDHPAMWGCFPMAPFAGRIRDGVLRWDGEAHQLATDLLPPHAIHGTVLRRAWDVDDTTDTTARLSTDLGPGWPWRGRVVQEVALVDATSVALRLEVHATAAPFPATCGYHPWFAGGALEPRPSGGERETDVVPAEAMYRRDEAGIPDGTLVPPPPGPWDDCFVGVRWPVRVRFADGAVLDVSSPADHVVVYSEPDHAVCVEPQTGPPDAPHLGLAATVTPDRPLVLEVRLAVGR